MKKMSIKAKLLLIIISTGFIISGFMILVFGNRSYKLAESVMLKDAMFFTTIMTENLSVGLQAAFFDDGASLRQTLSSVKSEDEDALITQISVFSENKNLVEVLDQNNKVEFDLQNADEVEVVNYQNYTQIVSPIKDNNRVIGYVGIQFSKRYIRNQMTVFRTYTTVVGLIFIAITILVSVLFANKIVLPLKQTVSLLKDIAQGNGDLTKRLNIKSHDEIGEMAKWFDLFVEKIQTIISDIYCNTEQLNQFSQKLISVSAEIFNESALINKQISSVSNTALDIHSKTSSISDASNTAANSVNMVSLATQTMLDNINDMSDNANKTAINVKDVVKSISVTQENISLISHNIDEVVTQINSSASAIEQMNATLSEVAKNTYEANQISRDANEKSIATSQKMSELQKSALQVGKIVKVINDIADQTNMLALNATIEAASAGEAGKGFAVVANEVKALAKQTSEATDKIAQEINEMQSFTHISVESIKEISTVIENLSRINTMIASSIEEQTIATNEISSSVTGAANSATRIGDFIHEISDSVQTITENAHFASDNVSQIANKTIETSGISKEVAENVIQINSVVDEIAQNSVRITGEVSDINLSLDQVTNISNENSEIAENLSFTANEVSDVSVKLKKLINMFKI